MLQYYSLSMTVHMLNHILVSFHKIGILVQLLIKNLCQFVKSFSNRLSSYLILVLMNVLKVVCLGLIILVNEIFHYFI